MTKQHPPIGATALGFPRIGRDRELKKALDSYWSDAITGADLDEVAARVRRDALDSMSGAGLDTVPVNTFSWYDHVLDTAVLLGAIPPRFQAVTGEDRLAGFDATRYFAMARGTAEVAPLEMTKWFDTNYHYLVPEIGPETPFALDPSKPLAELAEATELGLAARPVVVGPYTFLALAKAAEGAPSGFDPLDRLPDLVEVYIELLGKLSAAGAQWVQLDEPALVRDLTDEQLAHVAEAYGRLAAVEQRPEILAATYFADPAGAVPTLVGAGVEGVAVDLVRGADPDGLGDVPGIEEVAVVLGVVDGRNIWRADLRAALASLQEWHGVGASTPVSTSCSLLHVPYDVEREVDLDPALRANLAFADQKLTEVVALASALEDGSTEGEAFRASDAALASRDAMPGLRREEVAARLESVSPDDRRRESQPERDAAQARRFALPPLPTTTIGSFPQTARIRRVRADHRAGRLGAEEYAAAMRGEVADVIARQEDLGLDVLVHGEPERNDMVQYFAEQLDGYVATKHGWVQSYGSRCVRPPILYGDVSRPSPMTLEWAEYALTLTDKPVKGMLTGPVTMLAWSFVRDDQPRSVTADQVALALRDEVTDLEAAGIGMIQVDEPALRETLPVRAADQRTYLAWAVDAFCLATSGVRVDTQIHTHLCYSEFGEIIDAIDGLNADVTSIEAARSRMELLGDIAEHGFSGAVGPGVYDIHSPRVPDEAEISELLRAALRSLPATQLWVNPDCGLKTRGYDEVTPALGHLTAAAATVRAELAG